MKNSKMLAIVVLALGLIVCQAKVSEAATMSTAFTYQGRLIDANDAADGLYDFEFKLFDDPCTGTQQGGPIDVNDLDVIDGYFTVELDFGSDVFNGDARWLETTVSHADGNDPCTLRPRIEITPVPYALQTRGIFVSDAGNVGIGTSSPKTAFKLTVDGGDSFEGIYVSGDYIGIETMGNEFGIMASGGFGGGYFQSTGDFAVYAKNPFGYAGYFDGDVCADGDVAVRGEVSVEGNVAVYGDAIFDYGNVGIGTSSPMGRLDVSHDGSSADLVVDSSNGNIGIGTAPSSSRKLYVSTSSEVTCGRFDNWSTGGYAYGVGGYAQGPGGTNHIGVYGYAFGATNNWAGYFDGNLYAAGDVGIGTTSPTTKLDVVGTVNATAFVGDGSGLTGIAGDSDWTESGGNVYRETGNVGIGTAIPVHKLEVKAPAHRALKLSTEHSNSNVDIEGTPTGTGRLRLNVNGGANAISLNVNNNEKVRIDSNGRVGIGTTSPGQKLTVAGTIESTSGGVKFPDGTIQTTAIPGASEVCFSIKRNASYNWPSNGTYQTIDFSSNSTVWSNVGGGFNTATSTFTAPVSGTYSFHGAINLRSLGTGSMIFGVINAAGKNYVCSYETDPDTQDTVPVSLTTHLNAGQTALLRAFVSDTSAPAQVYGNTSASYAFTYFAGARVF